MLNFILYKIHDLCWVLVSNCQFVHWFLTTVLDSFPYDQSKMSRREKKKMSWKPSKKKLKNDVFQIDCSDWKSNEYSTRSMQAMECLKMPVAHEVNISLDLNWTGSFCWLIFVIVIIVIVCYCGNQWNVPRNTRSLSEL